MSRWIQDGRWKDVQNCAPPVFLTAFIIYFFLFPFRNLRFDSLTCTKAAGKHGFFSLFFFFNVMKKLALFREMLFGPMGLIWA